MGLSGGVPQPGCLNKQSLASGCFSSTPAATHTFTHRARLYAMSGFSSASHYHHINLNKQ